MVNAFFDVLDYLINPSPQDVQDAINYMEEAQRELENQHHQHEEEGENK
jgi:hypothetical protein